MAEDTELGQRVDALRPDLTALVRDLYAHPEIGFEEHATVARIAALLSVAVLR